MPHLVILYTPDLDAGAGGGAGVGADSHGLAMGPLCSALAAAMRAQRDEAGAPVFPPGGVRVLAYPAAYSAVADEGSAGQAAGGSGDYGFMYLNLRMARGRSPAVQQAVGQALLAVVQAAAAPLLPRRHVGFTLQIDEGAEVFDGKASSLHPLFRPA